MLLEASSQGTQGDLPRMLGGRGPAWQETAGVTPPGIHALPSVPGLPSPFPEAWAEEGAGGRV